MDKEMDKSKTNEYAPAQEEIECANSIDAIFWLIASTILVTPNGKRPSEGLDVLAEKMADAITSQDDRYNRAMRRLHKNALRRLGPFLEVIDVLKGSISKEDKTRLVNKLIELYGLVYNNARLIKADNIKNLSIELDGIRINVASAVEAAAKAISEKGGWIGNVLYLGPADEERRKEYITNRKEYITLAKYRGSEAELEILAMHEENRKATQLTPDNLTEVWKQFKRGEYTHLMFNTGAMTRNLPAVAVGSRSPRFKVTDERPYIFAALLAVRGVHVNVSSDNSIYLGHKQLNELLLKGIRIYALKKIDFNKNTAYIKVSYKNKTIWFTMYIHKRENRLERHNKSGKINVYIHENDEARPATLDLGLLAMIKRGITNCDNCLEKWLIEALDAVASETPGFVWSTTIASEKFLTIKPPDNLKRIINQLASSR